MYWVLSTPRVCTPYVENVTRIVGIEKSAKGSFTIKLTAPISDHKKLEKLEKVVTKFQGRSALSQGLIFLKVALCRQGIFSK